jgi:hypothetical protein
MTMLTLTHSQALISVLIPSYNHEPYIADAINSVLAQTHQNWELIIVDDASCDGSWDVIQSFDDPRIRSWRHGGNQGAVACLDEALVRSKGDYIAFSIQMTVLYPIASKSCCRFSSGAPTQLFSRMSSSSMPRPSL